MSKKVKNIDIWDIGLTKLAVFFGTLFIASLIPQILSLNWYFMDSRVSTKCDFKDSHYLKKWV